MQQFMFLIKSQQSGFKSNRCSGDVDFNDLRKQQIAVVALRLRWLAIEISGFESWLLHY